MNKRLNIYGISHDIKWGNKEENLKILNDELNKLPQNTDLVVLPEMFTTGFQINDINTICSLAEKNNGETIDKLKKLANYFQVSIAGTFLAKSNTKYYNRAFFIEPSEECTFYDKHHLFTIAHEDRFYTSGEKLPPIIRYRGWNIMPIICYDLRFPVWCRNEHHKYDLMLVMANWPESRFTSWETLLKARAIENQCYVCGINRSGKDYNGIEFPNNGSFIIDFKGDIISTPFNKNILGTLDKDEYQTHLERFHVWKDNDKFNLMTSIF